MEVVYFHSIAAFFLKNKISSCLGSHKSSLTQKKRKIEYCSPVAQAAEVKASVRNYIKFSEDDKKELFSIIKKSTKKQKTNQFDWVLISSQFNQKLSRACTGKQLSNCYRANQAKANLYGLCFSFLFF